MQEKIVNNLASLEFHIKSGDYFGTLATVLNLVQESENLNIQDTNSDILKKIISDLIFLQANYKIVKKNF